MNEIPKEPRWLEILREVQAMAQTGLAFAKDPYDSERYRQLTGYVAEMLALGSPTPTDVALAAFKSDAGYATPKMGVRGAVFREGRILLVRERMDGLWALPGGWADINQTPAEAIEREIREESGLTARTVKLAACLDHRLHHPKLHMWHHYVLFFLCEETGGTLQPSDETYEAAFFAEAELPPLSLSRSTEALIAMLFRHWRERDLPTEFDQTLSS